MVKIPAQLSRFGWRIRLVHEGSKSPGIYFLCRRSRVVYVGMSTDPARRVKKHRSSPIRFDFAFVLRTPGKTLWERSRLEWALISIFKPEHNHQGKKTSNWADESVLKQYMTEQK